MYNVVFNVIVNKDIIVIESYLGYRNYFTEFNICFSCSCERNVSLSHKKN